MTVVKVKPIMMPMLVTRVFSRKKDRKRVKLIPVSEETTNTASGSKGFI
jgi:hypothetical protein